LSNVLAYTYTRAQLAIVTILSFPKHTLPLLPTNFRCSFYFFQGVDLSSGHFVMISLQEMLFLQIVSGGRKG